MEATKPRPKTWADVHPFLAEIVQGQHDEILHYIENAASARRKVKMRQETAALRSGTKVKLTAAAGAFAGRDAVVRKVNQKTVTVDLVCPACGSADTVQDDPGPPLKPGEAVFVPFERRCDVCCGVPEGLRVSPALLEAVGP